MTNAHQFNLDAAQREIDRRTAEGEDMTGATIDARTYAIVKPTTATAPQRRYDFIADPGHGWLEVPIADVRALKIAGAISGYSYVDRQGRYAPVPLKGQPVAYLEEDCDLTTFMQAAKAAGWDVKINERAPCNGDAFVRRLERFAA